MHHDSLNFHNVVDLPPAPGGGLHLARFPSSIWPLAEAPMGGGTIRSSNACEIQFVTDKPSMRIYLRSLEGTADLIHLRGNQIYAHETLEPGKIHCLNLSMPTLETNRDPAIRTLGGYAPQVYRIVSVGATLAYHEIDPSDWQRDLFEKNEILRTNAAKYSDQVTLLEGTDIVSDFRGFQVDLIHPEPFAHVRMGLNPADAMSSVLNS